MCSHRPHCLATIGVGETAMAIFAVASIMWHASKQVLFAVRRWV